MDDGGETVVNKLVGNRFEQELCDKLSEYGFWAHNMAQTSAGQPADVIAVRDGNAYLIDCKVCENNRFRLSRIEENQENAMTLWETTGNTPGMFALKLTDGSIWMFSLCELLARRAAGVACYNEQDIRDGVPFDVWARDGCL